MGNARDLFLTNKQDVKDVYAITTSDAFEKLCVLSMAEMAEGSGATKEQMEGANHIQRIMRGFADPQEEDVGLITSGIQHELGMPKETKAKTRK